MFNSPFDSFHNIVAEAKEEREQLDRLLTISTPRERMLVVAIALLLCVLAAWLFLGNVSRSLAAEGVLAERNPSPAQGSPYSVETLVWIDSDIAPDIEAGMAAVIELSTANGGARALDGEIAEIHAVPWSGGFAALESSAPVSMFRVVIALDENAGDPPPADTDCRVVIELGWQSPLALFRMRQS
ncbi:MAG: hypothetical protein F4Z15_04610 [Gammaproteobacteria bacterium]|nr:hypothetical protein [Gammaproteobacteria bacterium]MYD77081.1 hypothetical protein [Gammaproteobacteria bacterium]